MFGIKIEGRLGNQLFQYAFALAQRKRLGSRFFIDGYKYLLFNRHFILNRYFMLSEPAGLRNLLKRSLFQLVHGFRPPEIVQDQWQSADTFIHLCPKAGFLYRGFFQSEDYFRNIAASLEKEFTIRDKYKIAISNFTGNSKETIVVHIRRTDYLNWGNETLGFGLSLPDSYYYKCLAALDKADKNILFLSDDIDYVKDHFPFPGAIYSENNTEITDLQLLMQGDYLVLSNSSFSWWGAYLNTRVKKVIAPEYWLGFKVKKEWPAGVVCAGWQKMPVW